MDRWIGKTAIVTGASAGIGLAIAEALVREGLQVVGLARRVELVQKLATKLKGAKGKLYPIKCDITEEKDILKAFEWTEKELHGVDVLVNNAAIVCPEYALEGSTEGFRKIMETNVIAMAVCTREAVRSIKKRKTEGHVFNINSVAGHGVQLCLPVSLYVASKHGVTAFTSTIQNELLLTDHLIKVTSISPGLVNTEMPTLFEVELNKVPRNNILDPIDIANALIYALGTPPHVQVEELTITPVKPKLPEFKSNITEQMSR